MAHDLSALWKIHSDIGKIVTNMLLGLQMRYLGTFAREEEAARAFDQEAIRLRGTGIELNLPHEAEAFMKRLKEEEAEAAANGDLPADSHPTSLKRWKAQTFTLAINFNSVMLDFLTFHLKD